MGNNVGGAWFEFDWIVRNGFVLLLVNIFSTHIEAGCQFCL